MGKDYIYLRVGGIINIQSLVASSFIYSYMD